MLANYREYSNEDIRHHASQCLEGDGQSAETLAAILLDAAMSEAARMLGRPKYEDTEGAQPSSELLPLALGIWQLEPERRVRQITGIAKSDCPHAYLRQVASNHVRTSLKEQNRYRRRFTPEEDAQEIHLAQGAGQRRTLREEERRQAEERLEEYLEELAREAGDLGLALECYRLRREGLTLQETAKKLGLKNHAAVDNLLRRTLFPRLRQEFPELKELLDLDGPE